MNRFWSMFMSYVRADRDVEIRMGVGRPDHTLAGLKEFADSHRVSNREPEANARAPIIPVWRASPLCIRLVRMRAVCIIDHRAVSVQCVTVKSVFAPQLKKVIECTVSLTLPSSCLSAHMRHVSHDVRDHRHSHAYCIPCNIVSLSVPHKNVLSLLTTRMHQLDRNN